MVSTHFLGQRNFDDNNDRVCLSCVFLRFCENVRVSHKIVFADSFHCKLAHLADNCWSCWRRTALQSFWEMFACGRNIDVTTVDRCPTQHGSLRSRLKNMCHPQTNRVLWSTPRQFWATPCRDRPRSNLFGSYVVRCRFQQQFITFLFALPFAHAKSSC